MAMEEDLTNVQIKEVSNGFVVEANYESKDADGDTNYSSEEFVFLDFGTAILRVASLMGQEDRVKGAPANTIPENPVNGDPAIPLAVGENEAKPVV